MSFGPSLTSSAELERELPSASGARLDRVSAAIASLHEEERRLARLGFEAPLSRCRQQIRYWEFLGALFAIESGQSR